MDQRNPSVLSTKISRSSSSSNEDQDMALVALELRNLQDALNYYLNVTPEHEGKELYPLSSWLEKTFTLLQSKLQSENALIRNYIRNALIALEADLADKIQQQNAVNRNYVEASNNLQAEHIAEISSTLKQIRQHLHLESSATMHYDDIAFQLQELRTELGEIKGRSRSGDTIYFWILILLSMLVLGAISYLGSHMILSGGL